MASDVFGVASALAAGNGKIQKHQTLLLCYVD